MTLLTDPTLVDLLKDIIKNTLFTKQVISIARCLARSLYLRLRGFLSIYTHNYNIENKFKKAHNTMIDQQGATAHILGPQQKIC